MKFGKIKSTSLLSIIALSMMLTVACSQDEAKPSETSTTSEVANETAEIKTMTGEELVEQNSAKKKDEVLIIDVRSSEEYQGWSYP